MEAYLALPRRHQRFLEELIACHGNRSEAVRRAKLRSKKYKHPNVIAWNLMQRPGMQQAYEELKAQATAQWRDRIDRWITELDRIATFDKRRLYKPDGTMLPPNEWPDDVASVLAGMEVDEIVVGAGEKRTAIRVTRKVKLWNKNEALKALLQFIANPPQRHEVTGKDGGAIQYEDTRDRNLSAIEALSARLAGAAPGASPASAEAGDSGADDSGGSA